MGGRACIRGLRSTVAQIFEDIAGGVIVADLPAAHPSLVAEDVRQALTYAAWLARDEVMPA